LVIGNNQAHSTPFNGLLDDVQMFNYALSPLAIQNMFTGYEISSISSDNEIVPDNYSLRQNYPNPFNPATTIEFNLAKSGTTTLNVYNLLGQKVVTLVNENLKAGKHTATFDASEFASGIYIYRIHSGQFMQARKMVLIK
jgi:hypothetical protein